MDRERVVVAEIVRPRGNRGEVVARSMTDVPKRFEHLKQAQAHLADGSDVEVEIDHAWMHKGEWVLKLAGVDSIDAAERFRGADIWVPLRERGRLAEGEFFRTDLIGLTVCERASGRALGVVENWQEAGESAWMEVNCDGRAVLIPFVRPLCEVDFEARRICVDLPDGLLDL
ncbi:MAG: 16S rRNA processing protein RimM [Acidobacteriaceae bacterium]|nr:16S rRNA processing protein RimM [Acidobacteriaceae bacterium]